jgi:predicted DNA-binding transcriptional regulator AlpA
MDKSIKPTQKKPSKRKDRSANAKLLQHRIVAEWLSVNTLTLRRWVERGEFPMPISIIGTNWLYDAEMIREYIKTGLFPNTVRFR